MLAPKQQNKRRFFEKRLFTWRRAGMMRSAQPCEARLLARVLAAPVGRMARNGFGGTHSPLQKKGSDPILERRDTQGGLGILFSARGATGVCGVFGVGWLKMVAKQR